LLPLAVVGHVERHEARLDAQLAEVGGRIPAHVGEDVADHYRRPGFGQCFGDGRTDTPCATRHQGFAPG
jgi:hypothetical protein